MSIAVAETRLASSLANGSPPDTEAIELLLASIFGANGAHRPRALDGFVLERQDQSANFVHVYGFAIFVDDQEVEPAILNLVVGGNEIEDGSTLLFGDASVNRPLYGSAVY